MKKKNIIIPIFIIVLALIGSTFMTVCTTDFMQQFYALTAPTYIEFNDGIEYETIDYSKFNYEKSRYYADLRYKIEPNVYSLGRLLDVYDPSTLVRQVENGISIPDDCYKKGIEYFEKPLTYSYKDFEGENTIYPNDDIFRASMLSKYVFLLYLDGQTEKSKSETEKFLSTLNTEYSVKGTVFFSEYLSYVYNDGNSVDKTWVLETEKYIDECIKAYLPGTDFSERFNNEPVDYTFADINRSFESEMTTGYTE